jgi:hypothetical protein
MKTEDARKIAMLAMEMGTIVTKEKRKKKRMTMMEVMTVTPNIIMVIVW